jgi:alkanesulfonate monooxygenase SsuD/methylene tetrahydromethanopterin reductase-like flavin-dependent oxidoreductase (luciferase family)
MLDGVRLSASQDGDRAMIVGVNVGATSDPVGDAQRAERLGFDFVSASDHPSGTASSFEVWTMLAWIAASTSTIRVATRVLGVPYRSPAMVAKMAETFDRLSGGRLILGLGGGYSDEEFRAFGLGVPTAREKVDGLREAIQVIRGLWSEPALTFEGRIHRTEAAPMEPKPAHRIPIWLGTYGPRALRVTGELADGWIPSLGYAPPDELQRMRAVVTGINPAVTCALNVHRAGLVDGPPEAVAEQLLGFAGFTAYNLMLNDPEDVEWFGTSVLPLLRQAG